MKALTPLAVLMTLLSGSVSAQDAITIAPKMQPGRRVLVTSIEKMKQTSDARGQQIKTQSDSERQTLITTSPPDKDGQIVRHHAIQVMKSKVTSPAGTQEFDSTKKSPAGTDDKGLGNQANYAQASPEKMMRMSMKVQRIYLYDKDGKLKSVKVMGLPEDAPAPMKMSFSPAALLNARQEQFKWYPKTAVKPGATWSVESRRELGGGQYLAVKTEYTFVGLKEKGGRELALVQSKATTASLGMAKNPQVTLSAANVKPVKSTGEIWFDHVAGHLIETKSHLQVVGGFTLAFNGQTIEVKLDLQIDDSKKFTPQKKIAPQKR